MGTPRLVRTVGNLAIVGACVVAYAALVERKSYTLRVVEIPVLPKDAHPIVALHLSDLHLTPRQRDKIDWLKSLAMLEPDLVIDTGDNVGRIDAIPALREALQPLLRRPGVYVDGSNDKFAPVMKNPLRYVSKNLAPQKLHNRARIDTAALHRVFDESGWIDLNNHAATLTVQGTKLGFVGTGDAHINHDKLDKVGPHVDDLKKAGAERIIAVTHAPYRRVLDTFVSAGADAIFAGHTHGGQVCVPGLGALTTNCDLPLAQAKGLSTWQLEGRTVPLHVSAGLGTSIYAPVRLACRPEATLITFVPEV